MKLITFPEVGMELSGGDVLSRAPYQRIADLDPLGAASRLANLPNLNLQADIPGLLTVLRAISPSMMQAAQMNPFDAAAATRDLGMVLASLKRHGVEPVEAAPEIEAVMLLLGETTGMAPRETVLHYSLWNPAGPLQRRFTHDPSEAGLVDAVRMAAPWIEAAVELLAQARDLPTATDDFAEVCRAAALKLEHLAETMKFVRVRVDRTFFATQLRPYFEPIRLGGRMYSGAAAAPLAVGMVDHLLWSSDCVDPVYRGFQSHLMEYGLPSGKRLYKATLGHASIVSRFVAERRHAQVPLRLLEASTRALDELFKVLLAFRSRHTGIANSAYAASIRRYPVGSAGYGMDTLMILLQQTLDARSRVLSGA